jgi:hypothetical protein
MLNRFFRSFGGGGHLDRRLMSRAARDYLIQQKFTSVLWNVVPRDWDDPEGLGKTAQACATKRKRRLFCTTICGRPAA